MIDDCRHISMAEWFDAGSLAILAGEEHQAAGLSVRDIGAEEIIRPGLTGEPEGLRARVDPSADVAIEKTMENSR